MLLTRLPAGLPQLPLDPVLRLATLSALGLAALTGLVLLQVLLVSAWSTRERRLREAFDRRWRPRLAVASLDEQGFPDLPVPTGRERFWWLMLWNRIQRQLRGDASRRLNRLLRLLGLEAYILRLLRRPGVRSRLVALETLRYLADPVHRDAVAPLARAGNPFVAMAAAHALIAMDPGRAMAELLPLAVARPDFGVQRLAALCQHAGRGAVSGPLLRALDEGEPRTLDRLVPLLGFADPLRAAPWARGCLAHDPDPRHRVGALQSLGELGDPRDHGAMLAALGDADPAVRLAAVEALRRQAGPQDLDALLPVLADRSWWVRQAVADTLVALPGLPPEALEALPARIDDRYGREALQRALETRGLPEAGP